MITGLAVLCQDHPQGLPVRVSALLPNFLPQVIGHRQDILLYLDRLMEHILVDPLQDILLPVSHNCHFVGSVDMTVSVRFDPDFSLRQGKGVYRLHNCFFHISGLRCFCD